MNILVFGAGAIGSLFGALLSRFEEVTLVGRKAHMDAVSRTGLVIDTAGTVERFHPAACTAVPEGRRWDLVAVAVKTCHLDAACAELARLVPLPDTVMLVQNGLGNAEVAGRRLPSERIVRAVVYEGAALRSPGTVERFGPGHTSIGAPLAPGAAAPPSLAKIARCLSDAGLTAAVADDIKEETWRKLIINAAINPLGAVTGLPNGGLVRSPYLRSLMRALVGECEKVAFAETGYRFDTAAKTEAIALRTSANRCSMLLDVERGRRTEIDFLNGKVVEIARRHGIDVPLNEQLVELIRAREYGAGGVEKGA